MVMTTMVNVMFMITMSMMHKNDDDDNADDAQLDFGSKMTGSCFFVATVLRMSSMARLL